MLYYAMQIPRRLAVSLATAGVIAVALGPALLRAGQQPVHALNTVSDWRVYVVAGDVNWVSRILVNRVMSKSLPAHARLVPLCCYNAVQDADIPARNRIKHLERRMVNAKVGSTGDNFSKDWNGGYGPKLEGYRKYAREINVGAIAEASNLARQCTVAGVTVMVVLVSQPLDIDGKLGTGYRNSGPAGAREELYAGLSNDVCVVPTGNTEDMTNTIGIPQN